MVNRLHPNNSTHISGHKCIGRGEGEVGVPCLILLLTIIILTLTAGILFLKKQALMKVDSSCPHNSNYICNNSIHATFIFLRKCTERPHKHKLHVPVTSEVQTKAARKSCLLYLTAIQCYVL